MGRHQEAIPLGRLAQFGAVCVALSWVPWALLAALEADIDHGAGQLIFTVAAFAPSLAALAMWPTTRRERGTAPRPARTQVTWSWPLVSIVAGAAPAVLTAITLGRGDLGAIAQHAVVVAASVGGPLGALAYTLISGPLDEEFGWRGFVQPRLRRGFGRVQTTVVLAIAWGLWHVPLFFLPGTSQYAKGLFTPQGVLFFAILFPITYTMLFVSEHLRGGVWAAVLLHASWNASDALLPGYGVVGGAAATAIAVAVATGAAFTWRNPARRVPGTGART